MKITVDIADHKAAWLIEYLKGIPEVNHVRIDDEAVLPSHQEEGIRREEMVREGEVPYRSFKEAKDDIFRKD